MRIGTARTVFGCLLGIVAALAGSGCQQPGTASSTEDKKAFTGPPMPADAQAKMREAQAKAMEKMRSGASPGPPPAPR